LLIKQREGGQVKLAGVTNALLSRTGRADRQPFFARHLPFNGIKKNPETELLETETFALKHTLARTSPFMKPLSAGTGDDGRDEPQSPLLHNVPP
jgi:hypothetical protein